MQDLLGNLRLYNSRKKEADKVRLLGMDYNSVYSSTQNSSITIFDFVTQLNESGKIPEVDEFALLLVYFTMNRLGFYFRITVSLYVSYCGKPPPQ